MIAELFNKMKSTEIVLTVKRSTMDQTIESEHDFFMSDTNESMFFHTLSEEACAAPQIRSMFTTISTTSNNTATTNNLATANIAMHVTPHSHRLERHQADTWFLNKTEIKLNPYNVDRAKTQINIHSQSRSQQIFEIYCNHPELFIIEPECGVIGPHSIAVVNVTIKNTTLPSNAMYIRIRVDKKQDAIVQVIIDK